MTHSTCKFDPLHQYSLFNIYHCRFHGYTVSWIRWKFPGPYIHIERSTNSPFCVLITAEGQFVCAPSAIAILCPRGEILGFCQYHRGPPGYVTTTAFYSVFNHCDRGTPLELASRAVFIVEKGKQLKAIGGGRSFFFFQSPLLPSEPKSMLWSVWF